MSELPERLRDAVADPTALVASTQPRRLAIVTRDDGAVAWLEGDVWTLPAGGEGPVVARWTTPAGWAPRFDTTVTTGRIAPTGVVWCTPAEVLAAWRAGDLLLDPAARAAVAPDDLDGAEVAFGVRALPLRTPTLPPATHTNLYVVGHEEALLVDPGSPFAEENDRLDAFLADWSGRHGPPRAIFLTHHHGDHTSGAEALRERTGLPIVAHRLTADRLRFDVDRLIDEGERFGDFEALHTPGHAPGHLCLWSSARRLLVAGDMVASLGTIVIDPPDGDMALYLDSLSRLRSLDARVLYPAHGEHIGDPAARLDGYRRHRLWREERVAAALPGTLGEVTRRAYSDVASAILWLAERQALAHLEKLRGEARATCQDGVWSAV